MNKRLVHARTLLSLSYPIPVFMIVLLVQDQLSLLLLGSQRYTENRSTTRIRI